MIKANAYGHGLEVVAKAIDTHVDYIAVADPLEALALSDIVETPVLCLGPAYGEVLEACIDRGVVNAVTHVDQLAGLREGARVHLLVDTGLHRLGVAPADAPGVAAAIAASGAVLEGQFCMVAHADVPDWGSVEAEVAAIERLALAPVTHTGGSSIALERTDLVGDLARSGLAVLGYYPSPSQRSIVDLRPCLTWLAPILELRDVPAGARVGYQGIVLERDTRVATLPVGASHGLHPTADSRVGVLVDGVHCPFLCPPSLDYSLVDVSMVPACTAGSDATILGGRYDAPTAVENVAAQLGILVDHILVALSPRIPRYLVP